MKFLESYDKISDEKTTGLLSTKSELFRLFNGMDYDYRSGNQSPPFVERKRALFHSKIPLLEKKIVSRMGRARLVSMRALFCILGLAVGVASAQVEVSVAGIRVVAKGYRSEQEDQKFKGDEVRAFNSFAGTSVGLLITSKEKVIVGMDEDRSKITVFGDSQGTDFTEAKGRLGRGGVEFGFSHQSNDKMALMTEVESAGLPAKGAKEIILKGELMVSVASKSALMKSKLVDAKKGDKVVVGGHSFEIDELGKPDWGKDPLAITLKSSVNHKDFRAFKFFDAEGKEIESKRAGSTSMGFFGKRTYTVTFNLKRKVDQIVLGLDRWTDLEKVQVPFDVKIGAGL